MKNQILKLANIIMLSTVVFGACAEKTESKAVATVVAATPKTVVQEAGNGLLSSEKLNSMLGSDMLLIDVRTPEEYVSGHIAGAVNINFYDDSFAEQIKALDQSKTIVVYCAVGGRSGKAYNKVKKMEFKNFYDLNGGIKAWNTEGLPLEK